MKKAVILFFAAALLFSCGNSDSEIKLSQEQKDKFSSIISNPGSMAEEIALYESGNRFGDNYVMIDALHGMLIKDEDNLSLVDSLSKYYFAVGNHAQSITAANEVIKSDSSNISLLERNAVSYNTLNNPLKAIELYDILSKKTGDQKYMYEIVVIQFNLRQYGPTIKLIGNLLEKEEINDVNVLVNNREVPMKAALLNIAGVIRMNLGQKEEAKELFSGALKIYPDFNLAANNLKATL